MRKASFPAFNCLPERVLMQSRAGKYYFAHLLGKYLFPNQCAIRQTTQSGALSARKLLCARVRNNIFSTNEITIHFVFNFKFLLTIFLHSVRENATLHMKKCAQSSFFAVIRRKNMFLIN